ncbi:SDR family NAD(P)-dependent oxidoreductase [Streptomyces alkaliterrae]|uniref:SDR family NAD(P)-dependent oxidoreductase n=1 Tax=Streptomyces alkaliterrae TaxID=2213162 RepID=UPI002B2057E4|nr:SDR family NAD(P)-dependent oxidoreductase [Streptomyces alkaliterrae]
MGMGRELFERERVFREVFEECAGVVGADLGEDLGGLLYGDSGELAVSRLAGTRLQQPALFAVQYAMAEQWRVWGVEPCVMLGHSLGEYVAAAVAGVWSLPDAVRLVCARGDLMQRQSPGAMLAVSLGEDEAREVAEAAGCVTAAVNSPAQSVLSGPVEAVERAERIVAERRIRHRRLATSHAFHSPMMEPMLKEFQSLVSRVETRAPKIPFISNVTGEWITPEQATSPSYWAEHVRSTVQFSTGVDRLLDDEPGALLLEVGPGTTASVLLADHAQAQDRVLISSMRHVRDTRGDVQVTREALAELWVNGVSVNWPALHEHRAPRRVPLPTYPFDTKRHWIERKTSDAATHAARLFQPVFRHAPLPAADPGTHDEHWLVFADRLGIAERWTARLRGLGERVVTVEAGTSNERLGGDVYRVRPETPEDFDQLVRELQETHGSGGTWNVLYLWAVDTETDVDRVGVVALEAPVHFARALGLHRGSAPTRLVVVTQGLARVEGTEPHSPRRALALGPVKTLPLENPTLSASVIDIEDAVADFEPVMAEMRASLPRSFVALRGATRFVEDVETLTAAGPDAGGGSRCLRPGGVYVITGGLGGVGRAVAAWMARKYQARLVLVGRTPLPERKDWAALESELGTDAETRERIGAVRELEALGAQVLVEACDVTDRAALAEVVVRAGRRFGAVQGVVHAAGLAGGGLAQFRDAEAMREVLAPKVDGTLALASVFGGRQLDFFAVFSSTAALLGNLGQVDYCAANAFLDAWADSPDAPANVVAVAWDVWRDVGMAAAERLPSVLRKAHAGREPSGILATDAVSVLERALFAGERRVIVSTESLPDRLERGARRHQRQTEEPGDGGKRSQAEMESVLTAIWKDLFGRSHIERDANFFELGGDSLLFVEAGWQIKKQLRVSLTVADLFKFPTIALLTEHLAPASSAQEAATSPTENRRTADAQDHETALVPLKAGDGHGTPLFLVHPAGGSVFFYRELADLLPADASVYGFQARGIESDAAPRRSVEEMASRYLEELRAAHPRGPYALGGASFGGFVALEMAQRLRAAGETVELLVVFDSPGPGQVPPELDDVDITEFSSIPGDSSFTRQLAEVYRANMEALRAYRPRPYPDPIVYFLAEERREGIDPLRPDRAWEPLAPVGLTVHRVPGNHVTMLAAQNVPAISRVVSAHLALADAKKQQGRGHSRIRSE